MQANSYSFAANNPVTYGQYLISMNGLKWIHGNDKECGKQVNISFQQYDIVLIEFDPIKRRVRFKRKGTDRMATLDIENFESQEDEWYLCVNILQKNDQVGVFSESDPP